MIRDLIATIVVSATCLAATITPAQADVVYVDLGGATTGSLITGFGASFAQGFSSGPLALSPSGEIIVAFWDPEIAGSPPSNSMLPQTPGNPNPQSLKNRGDLAMLLDGGVLADSLTFTVGRWDGGSVQVTGYDLAGNATNSIRLTFGNYEARRYRVVTLTDLGNFAGVLFHDNDDPAGLRFQNFSYNTLVAAVPEPGTWAMLLGGLGLLGMVARRRRAQSHPDPATA